MKVYDVTFDEDENVGLFGISLVNDPAMDSFFITLAKQGKDIDNSIIKLAEVDAKEKTLLGVALIPDKPIKRIDPNTGEVFYITFSADTIKRAAHSFLENGYQNNSALEHNVALNGMSVVEQWIVKDPLNDTANAYGLPKEDIVKGSMVVKMKCRDEEIYQKAVNGEINGFSIDGLFNLKRINLKSEQMEIKDLKDSIVAGFEAVLSKFQPTIEEKVEDNVSLALSAIATAEDVETLEAVTQEFDAEDESIKEAIDAKKLELTETDEVVDDSEDIKAMVTELTNQFGEKVDAIKLELSKENEILKAEIVTLTAEKDALEVKLAAKKKVHAPIETVKAFEDMTPLEQYRHSKQN
jgi:hypothetical protein